MSQGAADMLGREAGRAPGGRLPEQLPRRTVHQNAKSLAAVPLFTGFSSKHLKRLATQADELTFEPRQLLHERIALGHEVARFDAEQGACLCGRFTHARISYTTA